MSRHFLFPLLLLAAALGCGKKPAPDDEGKRVGLGDEQFANRAFTITIRDRKAGDRFEVAEAGSGKTTVNEDFGDNKKKTEEHSGSSKYVFTEELLEVPVPGAAAAKARRVYTTAEQTHDGMTTAAEFQGKAVTVQLGNFGYEFRMDPDGKLIAARHMGDRHPEHLHRQYNPVARESKPQDLLAGRAVRVNEPWELNRDVVGKVFVPPGAKLDPARTTATGRLTRVYDKDGRRFGTIVYDLNLALLDASPPETVLKLQPGSGVKLEITVDLGIDGSTSDSEVRVKVVVDTVLGSDGTNGRPREVRIHTVGHDEITTKTAK